MEMHHFKPHGAIYGQMARDLELARAGIRACKVFGDKVAFVGLAGTMHEAAASMEKVNFIPGKPHFLSFSFSFRRRAINISDMYLEWFADLKYDETGKLLITK